MLLRVLTGFLVVALTASGGVLAQNRVKTETIKPSDRPAAATPQQIAGSPEIITDLSRLPAPVARMRERILAAARSGDLNKVAEVMKSNADLTVFSLADEKDPVAFWKSTYPDSEGVEALSILVTILETGFVLAEAGTPQEIYLWPYFARVPLKALSPEQKVELFRIVTGSDYKDMVEFGAYAFYRLGIGPDGAWHYFVAGD
jgi:hypothetical protein